MPDAPPTPKPGAGPFSKLNPRQKRILAAGGVAVVLALIFALQRGGGGGAPVEEEVVADPAGQAGAPPFGSTFADNGEAAGQLGTAITESLADVAASNDGVQFALEDLSDRLIDQPATTTGAVAPAQVGKVGTKKKAKRPVPPNATGNHAQAGLRRTGTNRYVDTKGKTYKRVGKGRNSHFEPTKPKPKPKPKPKAAPRKPSTPPKAQPKPPAKKPAKPGGRKR